MNVYPRSGQVDGGRTKVGEGGQLVTFIGRGDGHNVFDIVTCGIKRVTIIIIIEVTGGGHKQDIIRIDRFDRLSRCSTGPVSTPAVVLNFCTNT